MLVQTCKSNSREVAIAPMLRESGLIPASLTLCETPNQCSHQGQVVKQLPSSGWPVIIYIAPPTEARWRLKQDPHQYGKPDVKQSTDLFRLQESTVKLAPAITVQYPQARRIRWRFFLLLFVLESNVKVVTEPQDKNCKMSMPHRIRSDPNWTSRSALRI